MFSHHCVSPLCPIPSPPTPSPAITTLLSMSTNSLSSFLVQSLHFHQHPLPQPECLPALCESSWSLFCLVWLTLQRKPAPWSRPACSMRPATRRNPAEPPRSCCLLSLTAGPPSPESFQAQNFSLWKKKLFSPGFWDAWRFWSPSVLPTAIVFLNEVSPILSPDWFTLDTGEMGFECRILWTLMYSGLEHLEIFPSVWDTMTDRCMFYKPNEERYCR